jgi:hypothetical protein
MYCGPIVINTTTIEFNVTLTLAGVGVAAIAKPAMYFSRFAETARTTITPALITWSDMTGGDYHVKIADDASLGGNILKTLGNCDFFIDHSAATYDKVSRRFLVATDIPTNASINAQADTALTDYDPPTNTELNTAFVANQAKMNTAFKRLAGQIQPAASGYDYVI